MNNTHLPLRDQRNLLTLLFGPAAGLPVNTMSLSESLTHSDFIRCTEGRYQLTNGGRRTAMELADRHAEPVQLTQVNEVAV